MSAAFGPADPLAAFRDAPLPVQSLVCRVPGEPDAFAVTAAAVDTVGIWAVALLLFLLIAQRGARPIARLANELIDAVDVSIRRGIG